MSHCSYMMYVVKIVTLLQMFTIIVADHSVEYMMAKVRNIDCDIMKYSTMSVSRSQLACAKMCSDDDTCNRFMFCLSEGMSGTCFLFKMNQECMNTDVHHKCTCRVKKSVKFGNGSCVCTAGYYGTCCENVIQDCQHGSNIPRSINTEIQLTFVQPPLATKPFEVFCGFDIQTVSLIELRMYDSVCNIKFNRTWDLYREGFGGFSRGYWMGLEYLYLLTNTPGRQYGIRINMSSKKNKRCNNLYSGFTIGDESSNYTINIGKQLSNGIPCSDTFSTGILSACRRPFSTFDHYSGLYDCPQSMQSGWWFADDPGCTASNLNGPLIPNGSPRATWDPDLSNENLVIIEIALYTIT